MNKRRPGSKNWAIISTLKGSPANVEEHLDEAMDANLENLKKKWGSEDPDVQYSVVNGDGDRIYAGRYPEGVVVRLHGEDGPVTFLTNRMVDEFILKVSRKS